MSGTQQQIYEGLRGTVSWCWPSGRKTDHPANILHQSYSSVFLVQSFARRKKCVRERLRRAEILLLWRGWRGENVVNRSVLMLLTILLLKILLLLTILLPRILLLMILLRRGDMVSRLALLLLLLELVIHLVRGNRANQPIGRVLYSIREK